MIKNIFKEEVEIEAVGEHRVYLRYPDLHHPSLNIQLASEQAREEAQKQRENAMNRRWYYG